MLFLRSPARELVGFAFQEHHDPNLFNLIYVGLILQNF